MSPGRENFKAHVQELKARTCPPIIAIEEGDGSAVVKFAHRRNGRMDIHFTFTNVDGYPYPQSSHVFVYMDAVDPNAQTASKILEPYAGPCKPLISLVAQVVRDLCVHFRLPLLPPTFEQGCPTSIRANEEGSDDGETSEDGDEEIVSDEELWNEMFEECPGINECAADTLQRDMCQLLTIYDVNDVRDDKGRPKKERKPRYAAGILSAFRHGFFVWVTREFSSLGLDGNVLEAWGIDVATFPRLAIVFQFSPAYVESKDDTCDKKYPNVRVALSKKERITSFSEVSHLFSEHGEPPDTESDYDVDQWVLTEPIQQALSRRMRHVVNLRAAHSLSFVQAEALFDVLANKGTDGSASNDDIQIRSPNLDKVKNIRETFDTEGCVRPRTRRAIEDARRDENNFLFSAVEYVEYRILNTTKYCIVCYEKMDESVELLKPFVCNRPLCLYNFIDQGLGTDVEGEILRNGNVVDLLVSLAYVAACARALEPFPRGIVCKEQVPDVGTGRILKGSGRELHGCPKVDWLKDSVVGRHIRISGVPGTYRIEQVMSKSLCLLSTPVSAKWETGSGKEYTIMTTVEKTFETPTKSPDYDKVIQCISAIPSIECMANILRRADEPPVKKATLKMNASQADRVRLKKHFEKLPEGNLAYLLLRWIVCSNRAHFRELQGNEAIQGVHPNYTQFAMVTGSPEKESNFKQALKTHAGNKQALYAFHGSPLQNWHSIIRHGLWYKAIAHGRSYGDGIYHALDSGTSLGYCRGMLHQQWSASALKPGLCISLNQIVNRPEIFTSSHPHLVVQHTEWVQTRYLLVCSAHTGAPAASAILPNASTNYLPLDATYAPSMQGVRISIPHNTISRPLSPTHRIRDYMGAGEVTVVEAEVKRMISKLELISRRNDNSPVGWYKTTSKNKDASDKTDDTLRDLQPKVGIGPFVIPGVEIETVPKPSYATSTATKTLTRDLRTFVKSMGVAGTKAGAWIDVEKAGENLFCWNVYVPRESFTQTIPLVHDMKEKQLECIAFEITFLPDYPSDPPFVRILHPRMLQYQDGLGGGHVTAGGSICMGFLTSSGWNSAYAVEAVLLQVRSALENLEPFPARLDPSRWMVPYGWQEAASAYTRVARDHGWLVPDGFSTVNREMSTRK